MGRIRKIVRSALTRFLPGWILALIAFPTFFAPHTFLEIDRGLLLRLAALTSMTLLGHASALALLVPRLRADAAIVGRKSIIAGACSVGALLITTMSVRGPRTSTFVMVAYGAVGFVTTFAMYLPWVQSRASAIEDREAARPMAELPHLLDQVPERHRDRVL